MGLAKENGLGKRIGLARELAWQENWLGKRTGLAREWAWQENWLGKRIGLARDLAWQIVFSMTPSLAATCYDRFKSPDYARHGRQSMRYWFIDRIYQFIDRIKYQIPAYPLGKRIGLTRENLLNKRELAWQERIGLARDWAWQEIWHGKRIGLGRDWYLCLRHHDFQTPYKNLHPGCCCLLQAAAACFRLLMSGFSSICLKGGSAACWKWVATLNCMKTKNVTM